jgi:low affinity Fe/Cu permease
MSNITGISHFIEKWSSKITQGAGSSIALVLACMLVLIWSLSGLIFHYSQNWALIMGTGSNVVTFLMVFLIQKSQNKHSLSIQLKLNELVAANELASNRLVNVEGMTEEELKIIQKYYSKLSDFAKKQDNLQESHSIDEMHLEHEIKKEMENELTQVKKADDQEEIPG